MAPQAVSVDRQIDAVHRIRGGAQQYCLYTRPIVGTYPQN